MSCVIVFEYREFPNFLAPEMSKALARLQETATPRVRPSMVYCAIDDSAAAVIDLLRHEETRGNRQVHNETIRGGLEASE